jgi:hypothetical protein
MACNIYNPDAPNGQPSELWRELNAQYDLDTATAIHQQADSLLRLNPEKYNPAVDVRPNGELTYAATMRLVSPLITGRLQDGLDASIPNVMQAIQDKLTPLYEGMRRVMRDRQELRATRTIQPFGGQLSEDSANLRNEANQLENTNTLIAYCELMRFIDGRLATINQYTDIAGGLDPNNQDHYRLVAGYQQELALYTSPLNLGHMTKWNSGLQGALGALNVKIASTVSQTDTWLQEAFLALQNANTTNPELKDNRDALLRAQQFGEDVNMATRQFGTTGDSSNSLVAMAGRLFRKAEIRWKRGAEKFKQDLSGTYKSLLDAAGGQERGLFDFMLNFKQGKFDGTYVVKESQKYKEERERIEADLLDPNDPEGKRKLQYNTVKFTNATPADLPAIKAHNIKVAELREKRREWWTPEHIDFDPATGNPYTRQGENHRYTQDFLDDRARYQKLVKTGDERAEWQPRLDLDDPATPDSFKLAYAAFQTKYYEAESDTELPQKVWDPNQRRKVYTGEVLRGPVRYVKRDFVTIQPKWESQGYQKIQNDTTRLGVARRQFYDFYINSIQQEVLRKLGPSQRMNFYGEVPRIRKNRSDDAAQAMRNGAKNLVSILRPNIDWNIYTRSKAVDAEGNFVDGVPIYMVGGLKSEALIAAAKAESDAADIAWRQAPLDKSLKEKAQAAKEKLRAAESAMEADDLETNLATSLLSFFQMAEEHHELKRQEPVFRQVLTLVEGMKFLNTDNVGNAITNPTGDKTYGTKGQSSNTWKQFKDFMDLNIYNNERADSLAERIGDGILRWSGSLMQGFNVGSQVNELVSGNINQFLQFRFDNKFGGSGFLKPGTYLDAQGIVMGGTMAKTGEELMHLFRDPSLLDKPQGKVAAVMEQLFIHQNTSAADALKTGNKFADVGYKALNIFEFYTQSTLAVARLKSVDVALKDGQGNPTGETKSLWDLLEFDKSTGHLSWPTDSITEEEVVDQVVQIRAMVASIHGNYNSRDRVAVQRYMLGRLAYQFKKWTYQLGRSRWGEKYYDEGLQDEREGRYRTVARFIGNIFQMQMKVRDLWATMPVQEKINVAKTASDLAMFASLLGCYVLLGAAAGDDDDDDALTHRLVNFMARQADRSAGEVSAGWNVFEWGRMLKNPMPILRQLENTQAVLSDFTGIGAYAFTGDENSIIVQRGLHRGEYKVTNSLIKLLPGGLLKGQWEQSKTSPKYFVTQ